jgi:hypothetical protein
MNLRPFLASTLAAASTLLIPATSFADGPAQAFAEKGHLAISSDANVGLTNASVSGENSSTTTLSIRPAADYFVIRGLSVGGSIPFEYSSTSNGGGSTTTFGIGARVGYDIPIGDHFSFWPRGGFGVASTTVSVPNGNVTVSTTNTALTFDVFAPFLLHPVEHFFLGLGPEFSTDLTGDPKATLYGIAFIIGGHCLGR